MDDSNMNPTPTPGAVPADQNQPATFDPASVAPDPVVPENGAQPVEDLSTSAPAEPAPVEPVVAPPVVPAAPAETEIAPAGVVDQDMLDSTPAGPNIGSDATSAAGPETAEEAPNVTAAPAVESADGTPQVADVAQTPSVPPAPEA